MKNHLYITPLDPYYTHKPSPDCDRYIDHTHLPDGSTIIWNVEKPGMYESPSKLARWLGFYMIIGAGMWAVIIFAILKVLGR
jgi:hypothetical protein